MILINKGNEPSSLTLYRKQPYAYFDGCNKDDIRISLLREQGNLCAYCMRRIGISDTRIEHWKPEAELTEIQKLDYSNMLAVCYKTSEGLAKEYQTCDSKKKSTPIDIDPRNSVHIDKIEYKKGTGEIYSIDETFNKDINDTLNLNCNEQNLPSNRAAVLHRVILQLSSHKKDSWKISDINKIIRIYEEPDAEGNKKEYAGIVLWYLKKRIRNNDR